MTRASLENKEGNAQIGRLIDVTGVRYLLELKCSDDAFVMSATEVDLLSNLLANQSPDWVSSVLRGLGEIDGDPRSSPGSVTSFVNLTEAGDAAQSDEMLSRRAWVNFTPTKNDYDAWRILAQGAVDIAARLGNGAGDVQYLYNDTWNDARPPGPGRLCISRRFIKDSTLVSGLRRAIDLGSLPW